MFGEVGFRLKKKKRCNQVFQLTEFFFNETGEATKNF